MKHGIKLRSFPMKHYVFRATLVSVILTAATVVSASERGAAATNFITDTAHYDFASSGEELAFDPESFGLVDNSIFAMNQWSFIGYEASDDAATRASIARRYCTESCILEGTVHVPSGARITGVELDLNDTSATGSVSVSLLRCPVGAAACSTVVSVNSGGADVPGVTQLLGVADYTALNGLETYLAQVIISGTTAATSFMGVRVFYKRQISPAPGVASFSDVPTSHPFFGNVEALAASGITGGCGAGKYCPDNFVTRAQMAAFLSRALGLHWDGF